jgi:hypothetical protein
MRIASYPENLAQKDFIIGPTFFYKNETLQKQFV